MTAQQLRGGTFRVVVLVLLLYVLSLFVAGFLGHQGMGKAQTGFAFQATLLFAGLMMFSTRERGHGRRSDAISSRDVFLAGIFVAILATADLLTLVGRAASDADLGFAKLPPLGQLAAEQLLAAFGEELLFTGFFFSTLRLRHSFSIAVAIVATIFVILHWPASLSSVASRAAYVITACAIFERTHSILLTIAMHIALNGVGFIAVLVMGDEIPASLSVGSAGVGAGVGICAGVAILAVYSAVHRSSQVWHAGADPSSSTRDSPSAS